MALILYSFCMIQRIILEELWCNSDCIGLVLWNLMWLQQKAINIVIVNNTLHLSSFTYSTCNGLVLSNLMCFKQISNIHSLQYTEQNIYFAAISSFHPIYKTKYLQFAATINMLLIISIVVLYFYFKHKVSKQH